MSLMQLFRSASSASRPARIGYGSAGLGAWPTLATAAALLVLGACKSPESAPTAASAGVANAGAPILIEVDASGYHPEQVAAKSGQLVHLVFKRTTEKGCGDQVVFPSLNIKKDLPVGQEVPIDVTMPASGSLAFTCGMDMYKGALLVK